MRSINLADIPLLATTVSVPQFENTSLANFTYASGLALSPDGAALYVTEQLLSIIWVVRDPSTATRTLSLNASIFAGELDLNGGFAEGQGAIARFSQPTSIATYPTDGSVYVTDMYNSRIRRISASGLASTFVGNGAPMSTSFSPGNGAAGVTTGVIRIIAYSATDSSFFSYSETGHVLFKVGLNAQATAMSKRAIPYEDGPGFNARFSGPGGIAFDLLGNLLVADEFNRRIRAITPTGIVSTLAGSGEQGGSNSPAASPLLLAATFYSPAGLAVDTNGDIFISDTGANNIRVIKAVQNAVVATLAGTGAKGSQNGPATSSTFDSPMRIASRSGRVYVYDSGSSKYLSAMCAQALRRTA